MSFSAITKKELCAAAGKKLKTDYGLVWSMLLYGSAYGAESVRLHTEQGNVAKLYAQSVGAGALLRTGVELREIKRGASRSSMYTVTVENAADREILLAQYPPAEKAALSNLREKNYHSFIAGAYLVCGSVWKPKQGYRAEFSVSKEAAADLLEELLTLVLSPPKRSVRRNNYILYYTVSEQVEDLLTYMGATKSLFDLMDEKILRDVRNQVNRRTNCDTANISKTVDSALRQCAVIEKLRNTPQWETLDPVLRQTALLRLECPESSLRELCALLPEHPSRSTLSRRLERLIQLGEHLL